VQNSTQQHYLPQSSQSHAYASSQCSRQDCLSISFISVLSLLLSASLPPCLSTSLSFFLSPVYQTSHSFFPPVNQTYKNYKSSFLSPEHQAWKKYQSNSLNLIIYVAFFFEQKVYLLHTQQLHSSEVVLDNEGLLCRSQLPVLLFDYSKKH